MLIDQEPMNNPIDLSRLASRWRSSDEWKKMVEEMDSAEPMPSHLNTINSSGLFHIVSTDKMSVLYNETPQHGHDVGVVQADCPAPTRRLAYYFEMTVKNAGQKGQVTIGFTMQHFKMRRQPGWEANSCGYHGDDGYLYHGQGKGESFGPTFTTNDIVGAGINYATHEFFFTKNAKLIGTVAKVIKGPLYPTIAVHSKNEEVTVNLGRTPFYFDIEGYIMEERLKQQTVIEKHSLQPNISHWIVRSYLLHYGYQDTLKSFDLASESTYSSVSSSTENGFSDQDIYALNRRNILRQLIMNGNIDSAFQKLQEWYPQVVQDELSVICFLLCSQRFIEYIKIGQSEDAVSYGSSAITKFYKVKSYADLLEDIVGLLAYKVPAASSLGYLLDVPQREFVADAVNAAVLSTNPALKDPNRCMYSCLEKLLKQLTLCSLERRAAMEGQGEAFYLHFELQSAGKSKRG
ncbi:ran-binding protein M homolog isoform X1 [Zingiber officinale]|uniref:ran-binding protein M homolog isoform X1 n=1 Tax=Zingiber officinale TaxID=94328 RepID=UPI001C4D200F|nr:ran-binding protein M homolog isoform X1 [Zingiber officinale]